MTSGSTELPTQMANSDGDVEERSDVLDGLQRHKSHKREPHRRHEGPHPPAPTSAEQLEQAGRGTRIVLGHETIVRAVP